MPWRTSARAEPIASRDVGQNADMVSLTRRGAVFVLDLGDGDNRFNGPSVDAIHDALDEIEQVGEPIALVTTASGKIWSNGLDLDWMATSGVDLPTFLGRFQATMARLLSIPVFSVAAIQGHVFAGGAMFALAHDTRIMRSDRGWFCLPEIDLGLPFGEGLGTLNQLKLPQPALHRLAVMGERVTGPAALELGVIDAVASEADLVPTAFACAESLAPRSKPVLARIRRDFYGPAIDALLRPAPTPS